MVAFYNAKDRAIYDAGDKFVPQTEYLQNDYVPTEGISYAGDGSPVSYANSGIMTQAPIIYPPIINQGGGGDGPVDPGPTDYGYTGSGSTGSVGGFNIDDIGEDTIDDEDIENNKPSTLSTIGKIGSFLSNPFGTIGYAAYQNFAQKKENEKRRQEAQELQDQLAIADKEIAARGYKEYGTGAASQGDMDSYGVDKDTGNPGNYDQDYDMKDGGRVGYFFGGRVNYKAGGRIGLRGGGGQIGGTDDMSGGSKDKGDPDDNREQYGAVGQYSTGPVSTKDNDDGPKNRFFNDPKTLYDNTLVGNVPIGLTTGTPYGRLSAIMDLNKTLEEEELEGKVQFDSRIGPVNTTTSYDTTIGPTFDASYNQGPVNIGYNNVDGINASYNKGPVSIGYNDGQATVNYSRSFAKGGRVSFKNGGLASIL